MTELTLIERRAAASAAGIGDAYLYQCITGRGDMDPAKAVAVEFASQQRIRRWQLRRDWHLIWPELVGTEGAPEVSTNGAAIFNEMPRGEEEEGEEEGRDNDGGREPPEPGFLHGGRRVEDHSSHFGALDTNGPVLVEVIDAVSKLVGATPQKGPNDAS